MSRQSILFWVERIGLSLAFGTTLVATRLFVLNSGFYDMSRTYQNVSSDWLLDFVVFVVCCLTVLVAHALLTKKRQTDMTLIEQLGIGLLGFGGLLGIIGTTYDGGRAGVEFFLLGGLTGTTFAACYVGLPRGIVYLGKMLDRRPQRFHI